MKKAERKDLEAKIKNSIIQALSAGQTAMPGKLLKLIDASSRSIAKKFAKETNKAKAPAKKAKKKAAPAKKAKKKATKKKK